MLKKILFAVLASVVSASSYAYIIGTNFTIENKTDVDMTINVKQPNGQNDWNQLIPAHNKSLVYLENGDTSILLYELSKASFTLRGVTDNKLYLQGRVGYYVGGFGVLSKYSFLNELSAADGLAVNATYSCTGHDAGTSIDNKIMIEGTATGELTFKQFPEEVSCNGFKSSTMDKDGKNYSPVCVNGDKATYQKSEVNSSCRGTCKTEFVYDRVLRKTSDRQRVSFNVSSASEVSDEDLHKALDNVVGYAYCGSW